MSWELWGDGGGGFFFLLKVHGGATIASTEGQSPAGTPVIFVPRIQEKSDRCEPKPQSRFTKLRHGKPEQAELRLVVWSTVMGCEVSRRGSDVLLANGDTKAECPVSFSPPQADSASDRAQAMEGVGRPVARDAGT
ncbi:hypothetical protein POSPLADRAFT_1053287 [Postia placenta MAD-698-R-SB12]|uniref:Uncharacterized protein n=1 Tax=Postia placenta MAD-698-R-SB12 TaxID=670580 RepID=A0A1X6NDF1_9APHY|nr:hypothetical protein POSPLADRAFT_1053287 [Postia placenta MAD-698-R-SB12]OSX66658.1 hypothetical protein POSPLADRAFT_1053287 [Postia placenta MAD-698-R-SB12]